MRGTSRKMSESLEVWKSRATCVVIGQEYKRNFNVAENEPVFISRPFRPLISTNKSPFTET